MPVRSLRSSVLKWPEARAVEEALRYWTERVIQIRQDVLRIGYFGSYARGDWGVGSDLDVVIILMNSDKPFERRSIEWDTKDIPVSVNVIVYTKEEWNSLDEQGRFYQALMRETVWVYVREND